VDTPLGCEREHAQKGKGKRRLLQERQSHAVHERQRHASLLGRQAITGCACQCSRVLSPTQEARSLGVRRVAHNAPRISLAAVCWLMLPAGQCRQSFAAAAAAAAFMRRCCRGGPACLHPHSKRPAKRSQIQNACRLTDMNVILTYTQFFAWQGLAGAYAGAQKITKK
jgi:hypothetical protein